MKKILIAEDNEANMKLFSDLLEAQKYDITKVFDGESALKELSDNRYDLLILDIGLPKLNGIELMKRMQTENIPRPATIIVSAYVMENEIRTAKMYGCSEYIAKPIDIVKFLETVEKVLKNGD